MRFVDTHTHTWGPDIPELPWQGTVLPPEWSGPYTARDLIADMDAAGVTEAVVVTTPAYGRGPRANEYTMRSIEAFPDRLWGVGLLDFFPDDPTTLEDTLERVMGHDRMLGVRMHACLEYDPVPTTVNRSADWIGDDRLESFWELAKQHDVPVFIFPKAQQLSIIDDILERHPELTIVIDHLAFPDETTDPDEPPWTNLRHLSRHSSVYVKVSSIPRSATDPHPYPDMHEYLERLLDWFGRERLMAGSDYPWMDSWADYGHCLSWLEEVPTCSAQDYASLAYRTFDDFISK